MRKTMILISFLLFIILSSYSISAATYTETFGGSVEVSFPVQPNPLTWSSEPSPDSSSAISMTATTATSVNTPLSYQFNETSGNAGATDSDWQSADTTYTDSGLSENTQYTYKCRAKDSSDNIGNWSSEVSVYTHCDAPGDAEVTIHSSGLDWIKVYVDEPNNPSTAECYIDCISGGATDSGWISTRENSHFYHNFTGLSQGTEYCFKAKYRNGDDVETSLNSNGECYTIPEPPEPPTDFTATTQTDTEIDLSWLQGIGATHTYIEYNSTGTWERGDGTELYNNTGESFSHTGLSPDTQYFYQAWSYNSTTGLWNDTYASDSNTTNAQPPVNTSVSPTTWIGGSNNVETSIRENFTFWQNGTSSIDITIGVNSTNFTFQDYATWSTGGFNQICANFTTDTWSTETNIADTSYPFSTVLKSGFTTGNFNFGVRIWMPKTLSKESQEEEFEIVLAVSEST